MTHRILLADDSLTIRKVVELTFSDEDFTIDSVGDGAQAIEHARAQRPDIIISDVIMPGLNGYELCQQVKGDPALQSVPFLFLKGTFESFDEEKARSCGSDGFIVKPFESQEMIAKVRGMIAAAAAAPRPAAPATVATRPVPIETAMPPAIVQAPPALAPPPPAALAPTAHPAFAPPAPVVQQRPTTAPPPIPAMKARPIPAPMVMAPLPVPPIPPRPIRPIPVPPPAVAAPAPPPPPPPGAQSPTDDFGFDFGEAEGDRFGSLAVQQSTPQAAVSPLDDSGESDEDLWSEVSLRGNSGDLLDVHSPAGSGSGFSTEVVELAEEAAIVVPEVLFEDEVVFEEEPAAAPVELPDELPAELPDEAPVSLFIPPPDPQPVALLAAPLVAPPVQIDQAEIERVVAARVDAAVRQALESLVGEHARTMIESIAWEVIPDLAEAMIRAEIERVRQSTRTD